LSAPRNGEQPLRLSHTEIYKHIHRQTDRQTDIQTDTRTQTHTHTHTHTHTRERARAHAHAHAHAHADTVEQHTQSGQFVSTKERRTTTQTVIHRCTT